jgi:hypothetical protein
MAKGGRRQYARDASGRFSSSGSTRAARPPAQRVKRGTNRLTRDNAGRITGTGNGATARGGRLRTAGGNLRATQTARLKGAGGKVRRPIGGGAKKPVGWMQSPAARNARTANAASRSEMAGRLKSLPKAARRSIYRKPDPIEAKQRRNRAESLDKYQRAMMAKASAKRAKEQQKPKRLAFTRVYHGTSKEAAKSIRAAGYKETPRGLFGPGVYSTTNKRVAREYADWRAAGSPDMTKRRAKTKTNNPEGSVLAHRVPKGKLVRGMDRMTETARRQIVASGRAATVGAAMTGKSGTFAIMGAGLANKTLIKQSGIMSAPRSKTSRRRSVRVRRKP